MLAAVGFLCSNAANMKTAEAFLAPQAAEEKDSMSPVEPVYLPGGVTEQAGKVGYLTLPTGDGLAAVDLATGEVLWQTKEAHRALIVLGNRLIARKSQEGRLRVVVLDLSAKGKVLLESEVLPLPAGTVVDRPWVYQLRNRRFAAEGRIVKGNLELKWWAQAGFWGGAFHTIEQAKGTTKSGVAQVNLETGKVEMLAGEKLGPLPEASPSGISLTPMDEAEFKKLPAKAQEIAKQNSWSAAYLADGRAYGRRFRSEGGTDHEFIEAVDVQTGKVIWERLIRKEPTERSPR
jgi:hypothetical protein